MAPTVKRVSPYRLFFYVGDASEPPHVPVACENKVAKFWLRPVRLQSSGRFRPAEIRRIQRLVEEYEAELLKAWDEYFGD